MVLYCKTRGELHAGDSAVSTERRKPISLSGTRAMSKGYEARGEGCGLLSTACTRTA